MPDYIAIPGQYSGDMWHVVAACLVRRNLVIVVTILSQSDAEGAPTIIGFFEQIGLSKRLKVLKGRTSAKQVELDGRIHDISDLPGKPLMWQHTAFVQSTFEGSTVHPLYRCTAMVMRAMEERGRDRVIEVLRAGFTAFLPKKICKHVVRYVYEFLSQSSGKKVLFVLGRLAGYNVEHDLDVSRLRAIAKGAARAGFAIVLVGFPKKLEKLAAEAGVEPLGYLDLRDWATLTGADEVDERARAYFWRCLVELAPSFGVVLKFVGGRSGSTDLPAFMGMETLCWDICDMYNPEYLRLLLTAPLLLQVTHVESAAWKGPISVSPQGGIGLGRDVLSFLSGTFKQPRLEFRPSKSLQKKAEKEKDLEGLGVIEVQKEEVLENLEFIATIVFILPYDRESDGQHFRTLSDPSTAPLAFNAINHALRPYYTTQNVNLPDLGELFYFGNSTRRFAHERVSVLTLLEGYSPTQVLDMLVLESELERPTKKICEFREKWFLDL